MRKKKDVFDVKLDAEEKDILASLERGEWKTVPHIKKVKKEAQQAAANYLRRTKEKRISIRIFGNDLEKLKVFAEDEGLPYQTLVTSILHKYTTGRLVDVRYGTEKKEV
ncbi:MAG: hypothetical protein ACD_69C00335G0005 [uncultured bacterium]|nr:MAG: hypothetical protein ACD_69C00335G0005 [uncultured bacterium]OGT07891.1 MAG: hypothetical protein A2V89_01080 [Gammaproteobacteria bacterium RBG_16_37_9]HBC71334.1 hypothetical protein [Coxiellaceae bacterium]HBS52192.1 hypothetical protein [Coxiellaceae bacterium]HBY56217.1 hypothetical protein [Coxiellaceae bacterium]